MYRQPSLSYFELKNVMILHLFLRAFLLFLEFLITVDIEDNGSTTCWFMLNLNAQVSVSCLCVLPWGHAVWTPPLLCKLVSIRKSWKANKVVIWDTTEVTSNLYYNKNSEVAICPRLGQQRHNHTVQRHKKRKQPWGHQKLCKASHISKFGKPNNTNVIFNSGELKVKWDT